MRRHRARPERWRRVIETVVPLVLAVLALHAKSFLHQLGGSNASTILLALVVIAFLIPQLRRYVLVLICFGVCVFSAERAWVSIRTVNWFEAVWTDYLFVLMWSGIAFFSGLAGVGEVWFRGPRWSQQSYLLAVALYFLGHAGSAWLQDKRAYALFLALVGIVSIGGVLWLSATKSAPATIQRRTKRRRATWIPEHPSPEDQRTSNR